MTLVWNKERKINICNNFHVSTVVTKLLVSLRLLAVLISNINQYKYKELYSLGLRILPTIVAQLFSIISNMIKTYGALFHKKLTFL